MVYPLMKNIYLDYNATMPLRVKALNAYIEGTKILGNPSSIHKFGQDAKKHLRLATSKIADLLNVPFENLIFTSGGTESNNTALQAIVGAKIFLSPLQHPSLSNAVEGAVMLPVTQNGVVSPPAPADLHTSKNLISLILAHNETGIVQDLDPFLEFKKAHPSIFLHVDAIQALGRIPLNNLFENHMVSLSSHKIGGPLGVGLLVLKKGLPLHPLIQGGGQQKGLRSGTENMPGILGFAEALEEASSEQRNNCWREVEVLRDYMEAQIQDFLPSTLIAGKNAKRLPNTSCLSMLGVESMTQLVAFDLEGIAISSGAACSSGTVKASPSLQALQIPQNHMDSMIRVSLGLATTKNDIESFITTFQKIYRKNME